MSILECRTDVPLQALNSFGLPGRARRFVRLERPEQVSALRSLPGWGREPCFVLGGGSNVLLQGDVPGLVLQVALMGRRLVEETGEGWLVEGAAGENWHDFVCWTLAQGWPGLENLALIPGTVGAAPVQNIGAYGLELDARVDAVDAVDLGSGEACTFRREDCGFAYRDSVFKRSPGRYLITRVRFFLPRQWQAVRRYAELDQALPPKATAQQLADAVIAIRRAKLPDPAMVGNAGSFFKNPVVSAQACERLRARWPGLPAYPQPDGLMKLAAGWLIERAGWKGRDLGLVGVYERQALVLVNRGGACGSDVLALAQAVMADVRRLFEVELEMEPVRVGDAAVVKGEF